MSNENGNNLVAPLLPQESSPVTNIVVKAILAKCKPSPENGSALNILNLYLQSQIISQFDGVNSVTALINLMGNNKDRFDLIVIEFIHLDSNKQEIILESFLNSQVKSLEGLESLINKAKEPPEVKETPQANEGEQASPKEELEVKQDGSSDQKRESDLSALGMTYNSVENKYSYSQIGVGFKVEIERYKGSDQQGGQEGAMVKIIPNNEPYGPNISLYPDTLGVFPFNFVGRDTDLIELRGLKKFIDQITRMYFLKNDSSVNADNIGKSFLFATLFMSDPGQFNDVSFSLPWIPTNTASFLCTAIASLLIAKPETLTFFQENSGKYSTALKWLTDIDYLNRTFDNEVEREDFLFRKINGLLPKEQENKLNSLGITSDNNDSNVKGLYADIESAYKDPIQSVLVSNFLASFKDKNLSTLTSNDLQDILKQINENEAFSNPSNNRIKEIHIKICMRILQLSQSLANGTLDEKRDFLRCLEANKDLLISFLGQDNYWPLFNKVISFNPELLNKLETDFDLEDKELTKEKNVLVIKLGNLYAKYVQKEGNLEEERYFWTEIEKLEELKTIPEVLKWLSEDNIKRLLNLNNGSTDLTLLTDMAMLRLKKIMTQDGSVPKNDEKNKILDQLTSLAGKFESIFYQQDMKIGGYFGILETMLFQGLNQLEIDTVKENLAHFTLNIDHTDYNNGVMTRHLFIYLITKIGGEQRLGILNALSKAYTNATSEEIVQFIMQVMGRTILKDGSNSEIDLSQGNNLISDFPQDLDNNERKALGFFFFEALMTRNDLIKVNRTIIFKDINQSMGFNNIFNSTSLGTPLFSGTSNENLERINRYNELGLGNPSF